jgi:tRNA(Ile)-lysidine synthase
VEVVLSAVGAGGLLRGDPPVVAMLSGGRDSVCLLDVAVSQCGAGRVRALHVNYGLRAEAGEDERHCRLLCERLGVELEVIHAQREEGGGNVQAWAREVRYRAALGLAEQLDGSAVWTAGTGVPPTGVPPAGSAVSGEDAISESRRALVAVGHTATDQVETILYRLAASPGRRALLGMVASEGRVVRPLLGLTREQTAAYCIARGLRWREDASNESDAYARGRVRGRLVPALSAVHPAAQANVLRTAQLLREETELLDGLIEEELGGQASIAVGRLAELPVALARLIVVRLAEDAAEGFVPQAGDRVAEILALAQRGGRAELHVGGLISAVIEHGHLRMVKIEAHYPGPDAVRAGLRSRSGHGSDPRSGGQRHRHFHEH